MPRDRFVSAKIRTVLFDLDGTLADTAPDLAYCLNVLRREQGVSELPLDLVKTHVSNGAGALIQLGFNIEPTDPYFEPLRTKLLDLYQQHLIVNSDLFSGMHELLEQLEQKQLNWGIVTNKPKRFTDPLINGLELTSRATCVISGDTTEYKKPHPQPIELACQLSGSVPAQCVYIGDAKRDIMAGKSAGTKTLAALFGYIHPSDNPYAWGADGHIAHPLEILDWLALNS